MAEEEEEIVPKLAGVWGVVIREGLRIITAVTTILMMFWIFAQPWADRYIDDRINLKNYAPLPDLTSLNARVDKLDDRLQDDTKSLIKLNENLNNVQNLLTEQRSDIKALLRRSP